MASHFGTRSPRRLSERLSLLPGHPDLIDLDARFANDINAPFHLAELLQTEEPNFEYILIDCPPHLDLATRMALVAVHAYVVPLDPHPFSYDGSQRLQTVVRDVRKRLNPKLRFLGYVLSRVQSRRTLTGYCAEAGRVASLAPHGAFDRAQAKDWSRCTNRPLTRDGAVRLDDSRRPQLSRVATCSGSFTASMHLILAIRGFGGRGTPVRDVGM